MKHATLAVSLALTLAVICLGAVLLVPVVEACYTYLWGG